MTFKVKTSDLTKLNVVEHEKSHNEECTDSVTTVGKQHASRISCFVQKTLNLTGSSKTSQLVLRTVVKLCLTLSD